MLMDLHRQTDQVGQVASANPLHHPSSVILHCSGADVELDPDLLARKSRNYELHNLALTCRKCGETSLQFPKVGGGGFAFPSFADCVANAGEQTGFIEGFFDKIEGAVLNGANCHINIAVACYQDDGSRIGPPIKMLHQIKSGHTRHANVGNDTVERLSIIKCY